MIYRCMNQAAINVGRMDIDIAAARGPHMTCEPAQYADNPTVIVLELNRVNR